MSSSRAALPRRRHGLTRELLARRAIRRKVLRHREAPRSFREAHEGAADALAIEAREPPLAGRPDGYIPGTVGPLELNAELDRSQVPTGETAVLSVRVRSPNSLAAMRVRPPSNVDGLRVRDGDVRVDHERGDAGVLTTLRADFLLVPERPGAFVLGALRIPYWDAVTERYAFAEVTLPALTATGAVGRRRREEKRSGDRSPP